MNEKLSKLAQIVLSLLPRDKESRVNMSYLRNHTGEKRRDLTNAIDEIREYYPVCATKLAPGGYWLGSQEDIEEMIIQYRQLVNTTTNRIGQFKKHLFEGNFYDEKD